MQLCQPTSSDVCAAGVSGFALTLVAALVPPHVLGRLSCKHRAFTAPKVAAVAATRSHKPSVSRWALHAPAVGRTPTAWLRCLQTSDQFQMEARRLQRELEVAVRQAQTAPSTHQMELRVREVSAVTACSEGSSTASAGRLPALGPAA